MRFLLFGLLVLVPLVLGNNGARCRIQTSLEIGKAADGPIREGNDSDPFALDYTNVTVLYNPDITSPHKTLPLIFGEFVFFFCFPQLAGESVDGSLGSVRKLLAMGFGTTSNSSFVPDYVKLCNESHPDLRSCIFWRGGVFTPESSTTWVNDRGTTGYNGSASNEGWDFLNAEKYKGSTNRA
jgi:hypothetical protein